MEKIDVSPSGKMVWITGDGNLTVSGGEGEGSANILVYTEDAEASVDVGPEGAVAAARCLANYAGDFALVARSDLDALVTAARAAEAVLDVLDLGKPLRKSLQRLRAQLDAPAPERDSQEG